MNAAPIWRIRAYAYAPRHERAVGRVPKNRGRVTTLIASLTPTGMGPHRTLLGGTSKAVFLSYLREEFAPTLTPGQVVILDNLGAHRPKEVAAIIEERGARVVYLPGYSPDFNPNELVFGKLKARFAPGRCAHARCPRDRDCDRAGGHHARRCGSVLCALRLPAFRCPAGA